MRRIGAILIVSLLAITCNHPVEVWAAKKIVAMEYPRIALAAAIQGRVKVAAAINDDGTVRDVTPVQGEGIENNRLLYEGVRQNLLTWKFETPTNDHGPSPIFTYTFKIEGATREGVKQQFVFERPGAVFVTSEGYCSDHLPCNEEEVKAWVKSMAERK